MENELYGKHGAEESCSYVSTDQICTAM